MSQNQKASIKHIRMYVKNADMLMFCVMVLFLELDADNAKLSANCAV